MSETPLNSRRHQDFDSQKAQHEMEEFEYAVYGTDFNEEDRTRKGEGDAYLDYMEQFAQDDRSSYDRVLDRMDNGEVDSIDDASRTLEVINNDPRLRRMLMMAQNIAELGAREFDDSNSDELAERLKDKQDKLNELLIAYSETENPDESVINYIVDSTEANSGAAADTDSDSSNSSPDVEKPAEQEPKNESSVDDAEAPKLDETDVDSEGAPEMELDETDVEPIDEDQEGKLPVLDETDVESEGAPEEELDETDVEPIDEDQEKDKDAKRPSLWQRARNRFSLIATELQFGKGKEKSDDKEKYSGNKKMVAMAIGAASIMAVAAAWKLTGHNFIPSGQSAGALGDNSNNLPSAGNADGGKVEAAGSFGQPQPQGFEFSSSASTVRPGEGWYETFNDMKIPKSEWDNLLQKAGPKLAEKNWAYKMSNGSWGISRPGTLPKDMLELVQRNR